MKKVLVTGGGGFIGKALVRELVRRGIEVSVVGRNEYPELTALGVQCIRGDICDLDFLEHAVAGSDTVFHVAAKAGIWGSRQEYYSVNLNGTENVLTACRKNCVPRLVYTSTPSVVFNQSSLEGVDETTPYAATTLCHYAASKIEAEKAVLRAHSPALQTLAIRPHLVWGPGDHHLVPRLLERGRARSLKIVGTGENRVDITYIDNVVHAHLLAAENLCAGGSGAGQAFFIGQETPVNLWQWVNDLFTRMDIEQVHKKIPFAAAFFVGLGMEGVYTLLRLRTEPKMTRFVAHQLAKSHWFSHKKAELLLGYKPKVSTAVGMDRLIGWLKAGKSAGR
jgi:nucleoside-diphosphate-sugar epimerase